MALESRFRGVINGNITFIGNTLGLCKATDSQDMGTANAIGAFITTNTSLAVPTYPPGTTLDISENSSSAVLNFGTGNEVLLAYLIWGGTYKVPGTNLNDAVNTKIKLTVPNTSTPRNISADITNYVNPFSTVGLYSYMADVTPWVASAGNGTYTVAQVPGTTSPSNNVYNCCGWTLVIIYKNPEIYDSRYINFYYGIDFISSSTTYETTFMNFETKPSPRLNTSRFLVSAMQGSANITGDQILFGPNSSNLTPLSGPNNPVDNFFCSQINNSNGYIDTSGTFGNRNHDALTATNIPGGRQGWDITTIDVESKISNSQTESLLKFQSSHDHYYPNAFAFVTSVKSPSIVILMNVSKYMVGSIGDTFKITMNITNSGDSDATYLSLQAVLPYGLNGVIGSVTVNGVNQGHISIDTRFALSGLKVGETIVVEGLAQVYDKPSKNANQYVIYEDVYYEFKFSPDSLTYTGDKYSRSITIYSAPVNISKTSTKKIVNPNGDTVQYTINVTNIANINVDNVVITDILPSGLSFVTDSVSVNGANNSSNIVTTGISLGTITPSQSFEILFTATVNSAPDSGQKYENFAQIQYDAIFNSIPYDNEYMSTGYSIYTNAILIIPTITKTSNKIIVNPEKDTVEYTITITNDTGNINTNSMTEMVLTDPLPDGLSYKNGSLTINGSNVNFSPTTGIKIPEMLMHGETTVIKFVADVTAEPTTGVKYVNSSSLAYTFDSPIGEQSNTANSNSNIIYSSAIVVKPTLNLTSNVSSVLVEDTIEYTATITNDNDTEIENVIFNNKLPNGISFIKNTLTINSIPNSATSLESNIFLGNITKGNSIIVKYSAHAYSLPNAGSIYSNNFSLKYDFQSIAGKLSYVLTSNTNTVTVNIPVRATVVLNSNKTHASFIGDKIKYTAIISNPNSNTNTNPIYDIILTDSLPDGLSYKSGSLTINNIPSNDSLSNVSVGSIAYGARTIVKFDVIVNTEPINGNSYTNLVTVTYKFQTALSKNPIDINSNPVVTYSPSIIIRPPLNLTTNKYFIVLDDTLNFTASITNNTSTLIDNALFSSQLPEGLSYIANSLTINDTSYSDSSFNDPIDLGAIMASKSIVLKYSVTVTAPPIDDGIYSNFFTLNYSFDSPVGNLTNTINSNTINLGTNKTTINPLSFTNILYKTSQNMSLVSKIISGNLSSNNLSYSIQILPSNGYASIDQTGILKYTPNVNFLGTDKLSILINNGNLGSLTVNVTIAVVTDFLTPSNDFPYCEK